MRVVPNGVTLPDPPQDPQAEAAFRARFAQPHEALVFFLGRLVHEKGVQVLLDAVPLILERHPPTRFVIAGEGPARPDLEAQARRLGIADRVTFYGYANDGERDRLLRAAQVAVFPSLYEPFGIVALEAMAAGTPVVATATGGFQEIVRHGDNGLLALPGSAESLAHHVALLLLSPGTGRPAGAARRCGTCGTATGGGRWRSAPGPSTKRSWSSGRPPLGTRPWPGAGPRRRSCGPRWRAWQLPGSPAATPTPARRPTAPATLVTTARATPSHGRGGPRPGAVRVGLPRGCGRPGSRATGTRCPGLLPPRATPRPPGPSISLSYKCRNRPR